MTQIRCIGIDPGSLKTGWGIVDVSMKTRAITHVENGVIFLDRNADLAERLGVVADELRKLCESFRPERAGLEDVFVARSPRSALVLGQARGAAAAVLGLCGIPVTTFPSTQVKLRVAGTGRAPKTQVADFVCQILGLPEHPYEDAADALAISICCALEQLAPTAQLPQSKRKTSRSARASLEKLARAQGKIP